MCAEVTNADSGRLVRRADPAHIEQMSSHVDVDMLVPCVHVVIVSIAICNNTRLVRLKNLCCCLTTCKTSVTMSQWAIVSSFQSPDGFP